MAYAKNDFNILCGTLNLIGIKYTIIKGNHFKSIILKQYNDEICLYFSKDGMYEED